jgi:hypothetical protein
VKDISPDSLFFCNQFKPCRFEKIFARAARELISANGNDARLRPSEFAAAQCAERILI